MLYIESLDCSPFTILKLESKEIMLYSNGKFRVKRRDDKRFDCLLTPAEIER